MCGSTKHLRPNCPFKNNASLALTKPLPQAVKMAWQGERQLLVSVGRPTGKELSSVEPLGGSDEQGLATDLVGGNAK